MTADAWWAEYGVGVAIGLTVLVLGAIFVAAVKSLRDKFLGPLRRLLGWARTLRITTTTRQAVLVAESQAAVDQAHQQARADAFAEVEAGRAVARPQPVWTVKPNAQAGYFKLTDEQWADGVSDVRIDAPSQTFRFDAPNHWPGPFNTQAIIYGAVLQHGQRFGVPFKITWRDPSGDEHEGSAWIDPVPGFNLASGTSPRLPNADQ